MERRDLLSLFDGMHVQTRPWLILSSERVFLGMESGPMLTPRENPLIIIIIMSVFLERFSM